jgi:hypothetical protein
MSSISGSRRKRLSREQRRICRRRLARKALAGRQKLKGRGGNGDAARIDRDPPFWYELVLCQEQREWHLVGL